MDYKEFTKYVRGHLKANGYSLRVARLREDWGGVFDISRQVLKIDSSLKEKSRFAVLTHEYAHFLLYITKIIDSNLAITYYQLLENWRRGCLGLTTKEHARCLKAVLKNEHTCEQQALTIIADLQLDVDLPAFYARANHNLWSYHLTYANQPNKFDPDDLFALRKKFPLTVKPLEYYLRVEHLLEIAKK